MLIPTGLERNEVRRWPLITIGLIVVNVAAFFLVGLGAKGYSESEAFRTKARDVEQYLLERPYLDPPPALVPFCSDELLKSLAEAKESWTRSGALPVPMVVKEQQRHLAALTDELLESGRAAGPTRYGYVPAHPSGASLLNSMFVHGGFMHLFFNMLFLFVTGPFLEDVFGRLVFALLYFGSGIAGALTHAWQHPDSRIPLIGASGAIAGVMGAFLLRLGTEKIKFLFLPVFFLPFLRFTFAVRAFIVLPLWFLDQWLGLKNEASGGVALWAHIGGFSFGLLVALAIKATRLEERVIHPAIEGEISWSRDPRLVAASDARHRGDLPAARRHAEEALKKEPEGLDAWAELVEVALRSQDAALIARSTLRLLDLYVAQGETQLARHLVQSVWDHGRDAATPAFLFAAGRLLEQTGDAVWAVDAYRLCAERDPFDRLALRALLRRAEVLKATKDLNGARDAVERALAHPFCSDRWYEEAERLRVALG